MGAHEYQYWNPCNHTPPGLAANWGHRPMSKLQEQSRRMETASKQSALLDLKYIEEGLPGSARGIAARAFDFIGIRAAVELPIPYGKDRILTRIESPGLWGIESDSGEDYLESVFQEESNILAGMLAELGVKVH